MSGTRERVLSPHSVTKLINQPTSGTGMGQKEHWVATGDALPCLIKPFTGDNNTILLQKETREVFRIRWQDDPVLDPRIHRLRITSPAAHAGRIVRLTEAPRDPELRGWLFVAICEAHSEDQQAVIH